MPAVPPVRVEEQVAATATAAGVDPGEGVPGGGVSGAEPVRAESSSGQGAESSRSESVAEHGELHDLFAANVHHERPKKKGRGCLVALIVLLLILGGIGAGVAVLWNNYGDAISDKLGWGEPKDYEAGIATGEALVTIKDGDTGGAVSQSLHDAGVTKTADVFYDYLVSSGKSVTFYPGTYKLQQKMTAAAALEALQDDKNRVESYASVPEGGTIADFLPQIAKTLDMPQADLEAAVKDPSVYGVKADSLEGWLFPAVYTFDPGATAQDVIQGMVDRTRESLKDAGVSAGDEQRVLTIASIIQREGRTSDFAKVSRVIENRLDPSNDETFGKLQMDSTAQYGVGELHAGSAGSSEKALTDPNPWNTYVHPGLPIGPISAPSDAAIEAAMHPADGPWLYFVTVNLETGETVFTTTYAEHQKAIEQLKQWCDANNDEGCYAQ
ncbi:MAG: endolytic transglycosylase MltG [Microbacterium sp.]